MSYSGFNYLDQGRRDRAKGRTLADNPYHRLMSPKASHDWCKGWAEEDEHRRADAEDLEIFANH